MVSAFLASATPALAAGAAAPSRQDGTSLRVPDSAFSPGMIRSGYDGTVDRAWMTDSNNTNAWFNGYQAHGASSFVNAGFAAGYDEVADWDVLATGDTAHFFYLGSLYSSASGASGIYNEGINFLSGQSWASPSACPSSWVNAPCTYVYSANYTLDGFQGRTDYTVFTYGSCLFQTLAFAPAETFDTQSAQLLNTVTAIDRAAMSAAPSACNNAASTPTPTAVPTATPTPAPTVTQPTAPDFTIVAARFEPADSSNYDLSRPALTTAQVGQAVALAAYLTVRNGPASCPQALAFELTRNGARQDQQTLDVPSCAGVASARYATTALLSNPGTYVFTATMTIGGVTHRQSTSLVVPQPAKPPKPPAKPSFKFDGVSTLNAQEQPQSAFRQQEQGYLKIDWHAKHLPASEDAQVKVIYQVWKNHGWAVLASPLPSMITTNNGPNSTQIHFFAVKSSTAMRFVVSINLLNRWSKQRSVAISIRR